MKSAGDSSGKATGGEEASVARSGLARVPAPWGKKYFCAPYQQKPQSFKWKTGEKVRKKQKTITFTVVILNFFEGNKQHSALEMN